MKIDIKVLRGRCMLIGRYMIGKQCTVRQAAEKFKVSKTTVHQDVAQRLKDFDLELYDEVQKLLAKNRAERHIRGGEATRRKFMNK